MRSFRPRRWLLQGLRVAAAAGANRQANAKTIASNLSPERNAQFEHINASVSACPAAGQPTISVDAKKRKLVGQYKNIGREWHPEKMRVHDFVDRMPGRTNP